MSVPCESPKAMGDQAFRLIMDADGYDKLCRDSKRYADSFGEGYCEKYRQTLYSV